MLVICLRILQEDGSEVYSVRLRLRGNPGSVHLHIKDEGGENGSSKLTSDCLDVVLEAGLPSCLMFDAPNKLDCGMRSVLGQLRVKATDNFGNLTPANFEVDALLSMQKRQLIVCSQQLREQHRADAD